MAYDRDKIYKQAESAIVEHNLFFIEDIVAFLPIAKKTFYEFYPVESDECNALKELLEGNKIQTKVKIRRKLEMGEKAAELLALYKLICSDEERRSLQMQHIDHTTKGESINTPLTPEEIAQRKSQIDDGL